MGGGLLQLVAYGAQDVHLTNNPQITFFKLAYRRHTNFSLESIEQTFSGEADFGRRVTCQISRNGDLIHRMYLQVKLPSLVNNDTGGSIYKWTRRIGLALIKSVDIEIGGQCIDKQYGEWMYIWNELTLPSGKRDGFNKMIGYAVPADDSTQGGQTVSVNITPETTLHIPLEFWFCRNPGLSLPLIALQYHEIRVNIQFRDLSELHREETTPITNKKLLGASLWVDYVFLDTDERRRFAQLSHEYLIEQLQFTGEEVSYSPITSVNLNFNHPVKELVWITQYDDIAKQNQWFNYTNTDIMFNPVAANITKSAKILVNGHDRFSERSSEYFNLVQPYQHHTNIPTSVGINLYSFALRPEEHQPSGTLNFSRLDSAILKLGLDTIGIPADPPIAQRIVKMRVYAHNYNVLRIMSGMGGLAYSN